MTSTSSRSWVSASDAASRLGVNRASLYAYVSRGFIRSQPAAGSTRERIYSLDDVDRLKRRTEERRAPDKAAAHTLQWGMPVLESSIALIDGERLFYRGLDAADLARTRTLEEVAGLIWLGHLGPLPSVSSRQAGTTARGPRLDRGDRSRPPARPARPGRIDRPDRSDRPEAFVPYAQAALALAAARDRFAMDLRPVGIVKSGARILDLLTSIAAGPAAHDMPAHAALARAWGVDRSGSDVIRAALVLCADHELNVSSFTARCVASAGSHPYAVVVAALAALEGPRHGGASARLEALIDSLQHARGLSRALEARVRRGESIDGFGHPLYRSGDPRARLLLDMLRDRYGRLKEFRFIQTCADAAADITGECPNVDFALTAARRVLALPSGAGLTLFAIGRTVGWIGHAIEQYATGQLIRPRAKYVGATPADTSSPAATGAS